MALFAAAAALGLLLNAPAPAADVRLPAAAPIVTQRVYAPSTAALLAGQITSLADE